MFSFLAKYFHTFYIKLVYGISYLPAAVTGSVIKTLFALIARRHTVVCTFNLAAKLRSSKKICTKKENLKAPWPWIQDAILA